MSSSKSPSWGNAWQGKRRCSKIPGPSLQCDHILLCGRKAGVRNVAPSFEEVDNTKRKLIVLMMLAMTLVGMASAANYMYEKSTIKGVGYRNLEMVIQTQAGQAGNKLVEKQSGSGNVILSKIEVEANRDPWNKDPNENDECCSDYINFSSEQELEYMPVSYQTGTYDQKWIDKLCVQNYYIGATVVESYTHAEHLQKQTEVNTRKTCSSGDECGRCGGALEANFNSNVIGVAHIGWLSKDQNANEKGRHDEYGRSVEDLTGVFSIEKFIQLWGNETCGSVSVDWLPCI